MSSGTAGVDDAVLERLDAYLDAEGLAAVWFGRSNDFAWLTGGDNLVDRAAEPGVAAAGYDGEMVRVVTNDIEGERLASEELPEGVSVETFPWHETDLAAHLAAESPRPAAADFRVEGFDRIDASGLRQPLTAADIERYRTLSETVASTVAMICRDLAPEDTERMVAADLRGRLADAGIDAPVVLVGGSRRAQRYRHYTPTEAQLGNYALVSVTARRGGLHASCTRTVGFDPPEWLADRHAAAARVEASALAATRRVARDGGTAGEVFEAIRAAYADVGHDGEWREHHQGGAAGYAGREWIARPGHDARVRAPMAYAWNPTIRGAKSEDTALVTEEDVEVLTATDDWPTSTIVSTDGSLSLARPDVLEP